MDQREQIAQILAKNPEYKQRKYRYIVIAKVLAENNNIILEPKDIQLICSLADEYRHQTKVDEVGIEKEKEYHRTPFMFEWEREMQGRKKFIESQNSLF